MSTAALTTGGLHKTKGSFSLVANSIKKEHRKNQKIKRAKNNKGVEVPVNANKINDIIKKNSNGHKINVNNIGSKGKTLNGKTKVKIKRKNGKFFLQK